MTLYSKPKDISAIDAKLEAQKIAFAPFAFQTAVAISKTGILKAVSDAGRNGLDAESISEKTNVSLYGVKVLLDMALSMGVVWFKDDERYVLDKTGYFLLGDQMARINLDFTNDVCYHGLAALLESIEKSAPEGLKVFGDWPTIYPALTSLPEEAKKSWFDFDHFYSDHSFPEVLPIVFKNKPKHLVDVGGNTGKWALSCVSYDEDVRITIMDLPQQLEVMAKNIADAGFSDRVGSHPVNLLADDADFAKGADVIWMSQFLDCFSEEQILKILKLAATEMTQDTRLYIMDTYWDRQQYEAAAYSINATSLYFTAMANGNSRMYHSKDMIKLIHAAGLCVEEDIDDIGAGHTLLKCFKK